MGRVIVSKILLLIVIVLSTLPILTSSVSAQGFTGSDEDTYTCEGTYTYQCSAPTASGGCPADARTYPSPTYFPTLEYIGCQQITDLDGNGNLDIYAALPIPPRLIQAEVWFWSLVYALWTLSGLVFTVTLIFLGFLYMTSQGDPERLATIKKRISQWAIGLVLVFLAYPILATFFSFIGVNSCISEQVELPGFRIFFGTIIDPDARCT